MPMNSTSTTGPVMSAMPVPKRRDAKEVWSRSAQRAAVRRSFIVVWDWDIYICICLCICFMYFGLGCEEISVGWFGGSGTCRKEEIKVLRGF